MTTTIRSSTDGSKSYIAVGGTDRVTIDAATGAVGIGAGDEGNQLFTSAATKNFLLRANYNFGVSTYAHDGYAVSIGADVVTGVINLLTSASGVAGDAIGATGVYLKLTQKDVLMVSANGGIGYGAGAGGTVTQATSKTTAVTLNKPCGKVTMNNATLAANSLASFLVMNSLVSVTDVVVSNHISGGDPANYSVVVTNIGNGSFAFRVKNVSAGSLSDALELNFAIIKGAIS